MSPIFFSKFLLTFLALVVQSVKAEVKAPTTATVSTYKSISLPLNTSTEAPKLYHHFTTRLPISSTQISILKSNKTRNGTVTTEAPKSFNLKLFTNSSTTETEEGKQLATKTPLNSSSTTDFVIPNAIRVNIPDGQVQMLYQQENQEHPQPKGEDIEETFTYQVKRQNPDLFSGKAFAFKSPWGSIFRDQGQHVNNQNEKFIVKEEMILRDEKINEANDKIQQLEGKLSNIVTFISALEKKQNFTSENTNSTIEQIKKQINLFNKTLEFQSSSTEEIRKNISVQKDRMEGQIQTLSMHLRHIQNQTSEQNYQGTKKLEHLMSTIQNATYEIRLNEVRTRYNQKILTTLDRLVQVNNEKIVEMNTSEGGPRWTEQTTGCGGIVIAEEGVISYKFRQPYLNNERCIWTLRANRRSRIVLQLLEDGFQNSSNSDFITVTEFVDDHPSSLITSSRIEHGNRAIHTFRGPLIFLTFFSDTAIPGNGFTLKFKGAGNVSVADVPNSIRYRHSHLKEPIGNLTYPDEKNLLYQPNEITTFTINPPSTAVKVYLGYTDLEKEESCEYDSVNFYGSVMASFALAKKYCEQQVVYTGEALQSIDGTFIIVFRSDASTQFKGFQFSWENL